MIRDTFKKRRSKLRLNLWLANNDQIIGVALVKRTMVFASYCNNPVKMKHIQIGE